MSRHIENVLKYFPNSWANIINKSVIVWWRQATMKIGKLDKFLKELLYTSRKQVKLPENVFHDEDGVILWNFMEL